MEDDRGQAEAEHEEVREGQAREHAAPRALQPRAVPHDAHEREVPRHARGEQREREQQHRVGPVGPGPEREQRVQEAGPAARRGVTPRGVGVPVGSRRGEVAARVVPAGGRRGSLPQAPVLGSAGDPLHAGQPRTSDAVRRARPR